MIIRTHELHQHRFASPLGTVRAIADDDAIVDLRFTDEDADDSPPPGALLRETRRQLSAYFAAKLDNFDLPLRPEGTEMQKQVWTFLQTIPYGETVTYGQLARAIGRPSASRAVGAANGRNPIWLVIPCHRVLGASGSLTGYAGGIERKRWLLGLERAAGVVQAPDECRSLSPRAQPSSIFCPANSALFPSPS